MVLISPKRKASRDAASAEIPARMLAEKNRTKRCRVHAKPQVEPIGRETLHDEAAAERVQRKQRRQLCHDVARLLESG
jgi:hypothetical protein